MDSDREAYVAPRRAGQCRFQNVCVPEVMAPAGRPVWSRVLHLLSEQKLTYGKTVVQMKIRRGPYFDTSPHVFLILFLAMFTGFGRSRINKLVKALQKEVKRDTGSWLWGSRHPGDSLVPKSHSPEGQC